MNKKYMLRKAISRLAQLAAAIVLSGVSLCWAESRIENKIQISGNLIDAPCVLEIGGAGQTEQTVDFSSVVKNKLYRSGRSDNKVFHIKLLKCDVRGGSLASFTFSGAEDAGLPNHLAVTGVTGVGIGLASYDIDGSQENLPLNKPSPGFKYDGGTNTYNIVAWVEGEPNAIAQKTISSGDFSATLNIQVSYQ